VLFILATIIAGLIGGAWLYLAEPWYDDALIRHLATGPIEGPYPAPWRDHTRRVAEIFPLGISGKAAVKFLDRNGFSCAAKGAIQGDGSQLDCVRRTRGFPCSTTFTVKLSLNRIDRLTNSAADSYMACV
jgi:hypothetical protein